MKKEKIAVKAYYIAALCFYIVAITKFVIHDDTSMGVAFMCLGSTNLFLGSVCLNKMKQSNKSGREE